jgi:tetratricopeptide (TPR) repeat protein
MGNYKEDIERKNLKTFLGKIKLDESTFDIDKLPFETTLITPLSLLAKTFSTQGDYQKSISIYLYLIDNIQPFSQKEYLLEGLGETYLRAGFLKRSESLFLEILKKHPRNRTVLYYLEIVYELLNEYEKAKETLIPLQVMGENTSSIEAHLKLSTILKSRNLNREDKVNELKDIIDKGSYRRVIQELFRVDKDEAWRLLRIDKVESVLDILWFLPSSNLNFDIILSSQTLRSLYIAKGSLPVDDNTPKSGIFTIDAINSAKKGGGFDLDLNFSYGCSQCKQHFPISFERCPKCYAIDSIQVKNSISKKRTNTGFSLL